MSDFIPVILTLGFLLLVARIIDLLRNGTSSLLKMLAALQNTAKHCKTLQNIGVRPLFLNSTRRLAFVLMYSAIQRQCRAPCAGVRSSFCVFPHDPAEVETESVRGEGRDSGHPLFDNHTASSSLGSGNLPLDHGNAHKPRSPMHE